MPLGKSKAKDQKKKKKPRRFTKVFNTEYDDVEGIKIIKDKVTGVNYLVLKEATIGAISASITPLIGADGKIVIDPVVTAAVKEE